MTKVSASRLKAKMGQYMKAVRAGKVLIITDRDEPVARLGPVDSADEAAEPSLGREPGAPPLGKLKLRALRPRATRSLELLREDRERR